MPGLCVRREELSEGDGEGFQVGALVVELSRGGGDFFYDEGVAGDSGCGSVDAGVVARWEFPDDGWSFGLNGVNDDFGDGLSFFRGDEDDLLKQVLWIVALDQRHDERGIRFGKEIADGYAGALALMRVFPELPVVRGDIEGRQDFPMILFDSRS